jgi:hypothetical protein
MPHVNFDLSEKKSHQMPILVLIFAKKGVTKCPYQFWSLWKKGHQISVLIFKYKSAVITNYLYLKGALSIFKRGRQLPLSLKKRNQPSRKNPFFQKWNVEVITKCGLKCKLGVSLKKTKTKNKIKTEASRHVSENSFFKVFDLFVRWDCVRSIHASFFFLFSFFSSFPYFSLHKTSKKRNWIFSMRILYIFYFLASEIHKILASRLYFCIKITLFICEVNKIIEMP